MKATSPLSWRKGIISALSFPGLLVTPMQLGPMNLSLPADVSLICSTALLPSSPVSLKPLVMTTAPFTPFATMSSKTEGTTLAGTTTRAMSTSPGTSRTLG